MTSNSWFFNIEYSHKAKGIGRVSRGLMTQVLAECLLKLSNNISLNEDEKRALENIVKYIEEEQ